MTPPTVNAYYDPQMNDINFPAGVLQPPLFDPKMDDAPNYGNTGGTIGHELTHGFDDEGRQFDAKGNLQDWWTEADGKEFEERAQCICDQYSSYIVVDDIKINGKLTLGRGRRRPGRPDPRLDGVEDGDRGQDARSRATASRPSSASSSATRSGPANRAPRDAARARHHRPALARPLPRQRPRGEHARVPGRLRLQGRPADGSGEALQGLVIIGVRPVSAFRV